jgi:hypothetical protein
MFNIIIIVMDLSKRRLTWAWRMWPLIVISIILVFHYLLWFLFSASIDIINKTISLFSQWFGVGYILYSIDSNIWIVNNQNLGSLLKKYLKEWPTNGGHTINLGAAHILMSGASVSARITSNRNPETIEEKIAFLQEQINELKTDHRNALIEVNKKIDSNYSELKGQHERLRSSFEDHQAKITEIMIGGWKEQVFGALLIIYGTFIDFVDSLMT